MKINFSQSAFWPKGPRKCSTCCNIREQAPPCHLSLRAFCMNAETTFNWECRLLCSETRGPRITKGISFIFCVKTSLSHKIQCTFYLRHFPALSFMSQYRRVLGWLEMVTSAWFNNDLLELLACSYLVSRAWELGQLAHICSGLVPLGNNKN